MIIIFDWDWKFLSLFWTALFEQLRVKLLYSTAYHSQTDDQLKRTNQTVKIALWYYMQFMKDSVHWSKIILLLQSNLNNFIFMSANKTLNEICYKTSIQDLTFWITDKNDRIVTDISNFWIQVLDTIDFTAVTAKYYYDHKHQSMNLKVEDYV